MSPALMDIPKFNVLGFLPPYIGESPAEGEQAPYPVALADVVDRFGGAPERRRLLTGLLNHRAELHQAGLVSGFQWIDGSFVEDKEWLQGEAPSDIDVVTFYRLPEGETQATLRAAAPDLFNREATKSRYSVDAHFLSLSQPLTEDFIEWCLYWHSLWGHRRDGRRKGYLRVDLSDKEDGEARRSLDRRMAEEGEA